jgi:hypothetical protein
MDMNAPIFHDILCRIVRETQLVCVGFDPTECNLDTFFEHIAQLSSKLHTSAAWHVGDFDEKYASIAT